MEIGRRCCRRNASHLNECMLREMCLFFSTSLDSTVHVPSAHVVIITNISPFIRRNLYFVDSHRNFRIQFFEF